MKVIFLNLHRARVDAFGAYGGSLVPTPNFDHFAAESTVFDQHYLNLLQLDQSASDKHLRIVQPALLTDLICNLRDQGVFTVLVGEQRTQASWPVLSGWKQLHFVNDEDLVALEQPTLSDGVLQVAIDWLGQFGKSRDNWLLWIDLGALLPPWRQDEYRSPDPSSSSPSKMERKGAGEKPAADESQEHISPVFDYAELDTDEALPERFGWRTAYGGVMHYLDDLFGQFINLLDELELENECLLAVSSPAGQPLGERSSTAGRLIGPYEERVHLPLIIRYPGKERAGRRVQQLTQPSDWLASMADAFEVPFWASVGGQSLLPAVRGSSGRLREYALSLVNLADNQSWEGSFRTLDWHFMTALHSDNQRLPELYRKPEDRFDMNNVLAEHPDVADHLELTMRRVLAWMSHGMKVDPPALRDDVLRILR